LDYSITKRFPPDERFGLTSQIRRAAASTPENLAEGCGKRTDAEFAYFVGNASGSGSELDYELLLAHDVHLVSETVYSDLHSRLTEARKMISALLARLSASGRRGDSVRRRPTANS
jgi:four helix bundle protein